MVKLIILFRVNKGSFSQRYEDGYNQFMVLIDQLPGLRRKEVGTMFGGMQGRMPYGQILEASFDSRAALQEALTSEAGIEAGKTLISFAGTDAIALYADVLEESYPVDWPGYPDSDEIPDDIDHTGS